MKASDRAWLPYTVRAIDLLEQAVGSSRLAYPHAWRQGGEWDTLKALPVSTKRQLLGAGYLTSNGVEPDILADWIIAKQADCHDVDTAIDWYITTARTAMVERRRAAHHQRHLALAKACGARSWHHYREGLARLNGYDSYRAERRARGWKG